MSELQVLLKQGLELDLDSRFKPFEEKATIWLDKVKMIVVTDESQVSIIDEAKEGLAEIKKVEKDISSLHKDLKEDALRTGQHLDSIKRRLLKLTEPVKDHLEAQVKFKEIQEEKRKVALREERFKILHPLVGEEARTMQLGEMSEIAFNGLVSGIKQNKADQESERVRLEEERKKKDAEFAKEQARVKQENEELRRKQAETYKKLNQERLAKKELENKLQAQKEKEEEAKKAQAAEARKLKRGPDKEKLLSFAAKINDVWSQHVGIQIKDDDAAKILISGLRLLKEAANKVEAHAKQL